MDVYFANAKVYDDGTSHNLVVPKPRSLDLEPNSSGFFTFTIPINDELERRLQKSPREPGTPVTVRVYLDQMENPWCTP